MLVVGIKSRPVYKGLMIDIHSARHLFALEGEGAEALLDQIKSVGSGFLEKEWIGRHLRLGTIDLTAQEETKRCGITLISQPGFDEDPDVLRTILRHNKRNLGIYCSIDNLGSIQLGDTLSIGE